MKYTTILFDSDDTLLDFKASERQAIEQAFKLADLEFNEAVRLAYHEINQGLWRALERGELTTDQLLVKRFADVFEKYNYTFDPKRMNDLYFECLSRTGFVIDGVQEILEYLKDKYELNIITNGVGYIQTSRLDNSGLRGYFKELYISGVIGAAKPSPIFFKAVLDSIAEKDISRVVVIGDSLTSDIKGACISGLDSIYIGSKEKIGEYKPTYVIDNISQLRQLL